MSHQDHPFISRMRRALDVPEEANFLEAVVPKFATATPQERKRDLMVFDAAQRGDTRLRQETQLHSVRRQLHTLDERLRKVGQ